MQFVALLYHIDPLVAKIKEEVSKFQPAHSDNPYPAPGLSKLSIQLDVPKEGKVGAIEWAQEVNV